MLVPELSTTTLTASNSEVAARVCPAPVAIGASVPVLVSAAPLSPKVRAAHMKPPKDSKVYKVAAAYVGLKAQGMKLQEISDTIGVPKDTISTYVKRAHRKGWLTAGSLDIEDVIEVTLVEKAVRNVNELLDSRDKETTLETAKGLGVFKSHQAVKVDGQVGVGFALRVTVEMPKQLEGNSGIQIRPGSVGGQPAIEAQIIEGEELK